PDGEVPRDRSGQRVSRREFDSRRPGRPARPTEAEGVRMARDRRDWRDYSGDEPWDDEQEVPRRGKRRATLPRRDVNRSWDHPQHDYADERRTTRESVRDDTRYSRTGYGNGTPRQLLALRDRRRDQGNERTQEPAVETKPKAHEPNRVSASDGPRVLPVHLGVYRERPDGGRPARDVLQEERSQSASTSVRRMKTLSIAWGSPKQAVPFTARLEVTEEEERRLLSEPQWTGESLEGPRLAVIVKGDNRKRATDKWLLRARAIERDPIQFNLMLRFQRVPK